MKYLLLILMIPMILLASAQDAKTPTNIEKYPKAKWRKKVKMATKKINQGNYQSYYNAAQYLQDAYDQKPDKIRIAHLLADVKRNLRDYQAAEKYYKVVVGLNANTYPIDRFYLGQMQKMNGKYEDAKKTFEEFINSANDENFKYLAKIEANGCDTARVLIKNPTTNKVEKTAGNVNTIIQDFSPKPISGKRILFASQKTDTAVNITRIKTDYHSSIFTAELEGTNYTNRTVFPFPINDPKRSNVNAILSKDEQTIVFNRCTDSLSMGNRIRCKLYRSTKKNGLDWNEPVELTSLNYEEGTTTGPAWGVDNQNNEILYFASDRAGGKGGLDIYYAKINSDGTFGTIQTVGDVINTLGEEVTPFYDYKNKTFYFSSDGHPGLGGLDVFKIAGTPGNWGVVVNAGVPVNSSADDLYLALNEKSNNGFLVSNRAGTSTSANATCCDDIWSVTMQKSIIFKGIYVNRDDLAQTPIQGVEVILYEANGNTFSEIGQNTTNSSPFIYPVTKGNTYKFNGKKEGYNPGIDNLSIAEEEARDTISGIFYLDQINRYNQRIPNVYFAFDKSKVIDFYRRQIDSVVRVLGNHPTYKLEIQAHTDSKGTDAYNQKLSERRAKEVDLFLVKSKNIGGNRIILKPYGETMPAVANEFPDGKDDPEGRAKNRRVIFKIVSDGPKSVDEYENFGEVVKEVKTGPGFTYTEKKQILK